MEGSGRKSKKSAKKSSAPSGHEEESKEFVESAKKKAIVRTHGIDNVWKVFDVEAIYRCLHMSILRALHQQ